MCFASNLSFLLRWHRQTTWATGLAACTLCRYALCCVPYRLPVISNTRIAKSQPLWMRFDPVCSASCLSSKAVEESGTALDGGSNLSLEVQRPQFYRGVMRQVGENSNDSTVSIATDMLRI